MQYVRRGAALGLLLITAACGGSQSTPPTTGTEPPARQCRRYANAVSNVVSGRSIPEARESGACTFDTARLALRCTYTGAGCTTVRTTMYATLADFVEEAGAPGRVRRQSAETSSNCTGARATTTYTYDGAKRPLTRRHEDANGVLDTTFTAWDAQGRPTGETSDGEACRGATLVNTYDDVARTFTSRPASPGTGAGCSSRNGVTSASYDPDGNVLREEFSTDGETVYLLVSTVLATATICL